MKKLSLFLLALLLTGSLMACNTGGTETEDPTDTTSESAPETEPPQGTYLVDSKYETAEYIVADYNVLNFGAVGDGVTDDTAAIQAAIQAANEAHGGRVFIPEGHYCVNGSFLLEPGVAVVGELEEGTTNGTVLYVYGGKGDATGDALFRIPQGAALQNIAIYYPEQRLENGEVIPYPYVVKQVGDSQGLTVENVTMVNAYNGFDFEGSLQTARNIHGTVLNLAFHLNWNMDIGKLENSCFSPKYWLEYGLESTPDKEELESYMLAHSTGMKIGRMDWTYFSDIVIEGYHIGYHAYASEQGASHGHLYQLELLDCYYPLYMESIVDTGYILSNCTIRAKGDEGATAVLTENTYAGDLSFLNCTIESEGKYAIHNKGVGAITAVDCSITAAEKSHYTENGIYSFINSTVVGDEVITADLPRIPDHTEHDRVVITKPASTAFINMGEEPYNIRDQEDITERLQAAIDSLKETGGMVYLPKGNYYVEDAITVHAGIEIRGPLDLPHYISGEGANIHTHFGENDPDGEALFTLLSGSGIRGVNFFYPNQNKGEVIPYSFTFRGNGENIYLCNLFIPSCYNAVDFATNRCDNHYVESLWGTPTNIGVSVGGGSENGIVRDCQFTPNCGGYKSWDTAFSYLEAYGSLFRIGNTKNQIFYHNFSFGAYKGLHVTDGAENALLIANGIDAANYPAYIEGNCNVTFINSQLVNLIGSGDMTYIVTDESFTGHVNMMNTNLWGGPTRIGIKLKGNGTLNMVGGRVSGPGWSMLQADAGTTTLAAMQDVPLYGFDVIVGKDINSFRLVGNLFATGKYKTRGVDESKLIGFDK